MIQLLYGNCLEEMKNIHSKSVHAVICDPPYGTTPLSWDERLNFNLLWIEYKRIIKDTGVVCIFGQEPFSSYVRLSNINNYRYDWYWEKERLTNVFQVKKRPGKTIETISVFFYKPNQYYPQYTKYTGKPVSNKIGDKARWSIPIGGTSSKTKPIEYIDNGIRHPTQLLKFNRDNNRNCLHPTQKPVALLEYLINTYTLPEDTVMDNTMGSGSTGIACINTNRNFIGIEIDREYFNIACKRIENAQLQNIMFY